MSEKNKSENNENKKYDVKKLKSYLLWKQKTMSEAEYWRKKYYGEI